MNKNEFSTSFRFAVRKAIIIDMVQMGVVQYIVLFNFIPFLCIHFNWAEDCANLSLINDRVLIITSIVYFIHISFFMFVRLFLSEQTIGIKISGLQLVKSNDVKPSKFEMVFYVLILPFSLIINVNRLLFRSKLLINNGIYDRLFKLKLVFKE